MSVIHLSDWAQQPSVRIKCSQKYGTPAWSGTTKDIKHLPKEVYSLDIDDEDDAVFYTFNVDKATCPKCLDKKR